MSQKYVIDENNQELLLKDNKHQVMMYWEKPYMKACIDKLQPKGHVLEIGFGMGYSATQIQKYKPKSHTIVEMDSTVIKRLKRWSEKYDNIIIVEGRWQEKLKTLGYYDEIFFDDYPLTTVNTNYEKHIVSNRFMMFLDICYDWHMKVGSKISCYLASSESKFKNEGWLNSIINNSKWYYQENITEVDIPINCNYFSGNKAVVPLITKRI